MAFWCKGKKDYCNDTSCEACNKCKFENGSGGFELEDDDTDGIIIRQWISVKDRLPEDDENLHFYDDGNMRFTSVLVRDKERRTGIANRLMIRSSNIPAFNELATDGWVWSRPCEPTHWMPLPEPPKEDAQHES